MIMSFRHIAPLLLLGALLLWAGTARSQTLGSAGGLDPARYGPMAVGDTWTYAREAASVEGTRTCPSRTVTGYERLTVLRDTTINGVPHRIAACQRFSADGAPGGTDLLALRVDGRARYGRRLVDGGGCAFVGPPADAYSTYEESGAADVEVAGTPLRVDGVLRQSQAGATGHDEYTSWTFVADLGAIAFLYHDDAQRTMETYCREDALRLVHASVGGVEVGAQAVRSESAPPGPVGLAVDVAPQPAREGITVRLAGPAPRDVRVELLDLLGRRVRQWDGPQGLGRPLRVAGVPAGLYVIRVTTGGAAGTARVVLL